MSFNYHNDYNQGAYVPPQPSGQPYLPSYMPQSQQPQQYSDQSALLPPSESGPKFQSQGYKDWIWGILFIIHLIVIPALGFATLAKYQSEWSDPHNDPWYNNATNTIVSTNSTGSEIRADSKFFTVVSVGLLIGVIVAGLMLLLVKMFAAQLIWISLVGQVVMFLVAGFVAIITGGLVGIIFLIIAAIELIWIYFIRRRIPFASAILKHAITPLQRWPATFVTPFVGIILNVIWALLWAVAAGSIYYATTRTTMCRNIYAKDNPVLPDVTGRCPLGYTPYMGQNGSVMGFVVVFLLLISYYWSLQVIKNVVHCTVAGVTATYYFLYPQEHITSPTWNSLKRATTTSFGSICLGSLILAVIRALRAMCNILRGQQASGANNNGAAIARAICLCLVACLLTILDRVVEYVNQYAYAQVAIYGKSYFEAARATWQLFKARGFDALVNDSLIGVALTFAALIGGILTGVASGLFAASMGYGSFSWLIGVIGFILGFAMVLIVMETVDSSVICFFVCLCEDPAALQRTKPDIYNELVPMIQERYPAITFASGYPGNV